MTIGKVSPMLAILFSLLVQVGFSQENINLNKFRQLGQELPTPNVYRTAAGAPGHMYWQQKADYKIQVELDDKTQKVYGSETITYTNNSPDQLTYIWLQLDQNVRALDSDTYKTATNEIDDKMTLGQLKRMMPSFDGGFKLDYVKDVNDKDLPFTVVKTMMRIDLPKALKMGESFSFKVKWWYNINDRMEIGGRSGYEYFKENDNYLYTIAQFFPRMCVYNDVDGWQNKQFLGNGEFTLPFGDYEVEITVPSDHQVAATGTLANMDKVLTKKQQDLYNKAMTSYEEPVIIVSEDEAKKAEKKKATDKKTWIFKAENVRDFAFASSRKFIWDAMGVKMGNGKTVLAMSMYPKEGNPLWEKYSTKVVAHTLKWYSHYTIDYPYPVAWSINAARIGMEYPMICFNYGRCEEDGTYSKRIKYGMIGVIIHEVGHNFFPMIINSDERQWTWMDEGLNTFTQFLTEQHWERDYPSRRGKPSKIVGYMGGDKKNITPIMTNSESIFQFGNNAYGKPATALNILRETILGRELFDYAFKEYSRRWAFKHPTPADFFRTMEDASGVDLDWFWRGWFYTTDHCDQSIADVKWFKIDSKNPAVENKAKKVERANKNINISDIRNKKEIKEVYAEKDKGLLDFYNTFDPLDGNNLDKKAYQTYYNNLSNDEKQMLAAGYNFYELEIENKGGLVMPVIVKMTFEDGTTETKYMPAEIWRTDADIINKVLITKKTVVQFQLDPVQEIADTDVENNYFPRKQVPTRFELFKRKAWGGENEMQRDKRAKKE